MRAAVLLGFTVLLTTLASGAPAEELPLGKERQAALPHQRKDG